MKRLAVVLFAALILTGCSATPPPDNKAQQGAPIAGSDFAETTIKLSDGRTLLCVKDLRGYSAISCDWERAK